MDAEDVRRISEYGCDRCGRIVRVAKHVLGCFDLLDRDVFTH